MAKERFTLIWPKRNAPAHFQATIIAQDRKAGNALLAAQDLDNRGFFTQVFQASSLSAVDTRVLIDAASHSNRLVIIDEKARFLKAAIGKLALKKDLTLPIVYVGAFGLTAQHIAEACLRNLESPIGDAGELASSS